MRAWPPPCLVRCLDVGVERNLGVDDDVAPARQTHDEVGPQDPLAGAERRLLHEIAVRDHACQLDDPAKLHFAPAPAGAGRAHRGREAAVSALEPGLRLDEVADLGAERARGCAPPSFDLLQAARDLLERFLERRDHPLDRPLTALEVFPCVPLQIRREGLERRLELLPCRGLPGDGAPFVLELRTQGENPRAQHEPDGDTAYRKTDEKEDQLHCTCPFRGAQRYRQHRTDSKTVPTNAKSGEPEGSPDLARGAYRGSVRPVKRRAKKKVRKER